ncbi:hypothetical protein EDC94DRAFT_652441 [Helicostylum pulchrum]|nr:hypothetical protein EDC94DRAFT_652441 [Helicostylum pulchrum]
MSFMFLKHVIPLTDLPYSLSDVLLMHPAFILSSPVIRTKLLDTASLFSPLRAIIKTSVTFPDPRTSPTIQIPVAAILEFYLNDVWFPTSDSCTLPPKSYRTVLAKDFFSFNHTQNQLSFRSEDDPLRKFPRLWLRFRRCLSQQQISLFPIMEKLTSTPEPGADPLWNSSFNSTSLSTFYRNYFRTTAFTSNAYRTDITLIRQIWKISFQYLFPRQPQLHLLSAKQVSSILYTFRFPNFFESNLPPAFLFGFITGVSCSMRSLSSRIKSSVRPSKFTINTLIKPTWIRQP